MACQHETLSNHIIFEDMFVYLFLIQWCDQKLSRVDLKSCLSDFSLCCLTQSLSPNQWNRSTPSHSSRIFHIRVSETIRILIPSNGSPPASPSDFFPPTPSHRLKASDFSLQFWQFSNTFSHQIKMLKYKFTTRIQYTFEAHHRGHF